MKFAFVTPRYGADIPSGAEHACRLLAEQVCERHGVEYKTDTWGRTLKKALRHVGRLAHDGGGVREVIREMA